MPPSNRIDFIHRVDDAAARADGVILDVDDDVAVVSGVGDDFFECVNNFVKKFALVEQDKKRLAGIGGYHQPFERLIPLGAQIPGTDSKDASKEQKKANNWDYININVHKQEKQANDKGNSGPDRELGWSDGVVGHQRYVAELDDGVLELQAVAIDFQGIRVDLPVIGRAAFQDVSVHM